MSRIFPSWDQIKQFRSPLTDGELRLAQFLDSDLPDEWEIYVQPHVNGDKPDLAILNPKVGLVFFEVKDWASGLYSSFEDWATDAKTGKRFKVHRFQVRTSQGTNLIPSPVSQVSRYRENLVGLYLPAIGEAVDRNTKALAPFKTALYFHNMSTEEAQLLVRVDPKRCAVFGVDTLVAGDLTDVVSDAERNQSFYMKEGWAEMIRFFLKPPFVKAGIELTQIAEFNLTHPRQLLVDRFLCDCAFGSCAR